MSGVDDGHTHAEGEFDQACPACVAQAAEDYVRFAHLLREPSDSCVKPEPPQITGGVLARVRAEVERIEGWDMPYCVDCQDMEVGVDTELVTELADEAQRLYVDRRLLGQANLLLARIVAAANVSAIEGADGFVESYSLPVNPIHKAIPFLAEQGIVVTEDGQIKTAPGMESDMKPQGDSQGDSQ